VYLENVPAAKTPPGLELAELHGTVEQLTMKVGICHLNSPDEGGGCIPDALDEQVVSRLRQRAREGQLGGKGHVDGHEEHLFSLGSRRRQQELGQADGSDRDAPVDEMLEAEL